VSGSAFAALEERSFAGGMPFTSRSAQTCQTPFVRLALAFALALCWACTAGFAAESDPSSPATAEVVHTNSQDVIQAFSHLQEQLQATQLAIEQGRQETKAAAARTTDMFLRMLQTLQENNAAQRAQDLQASQKSNQRILLVTGSFAAMAFLTMLLIAYLQWRMGEGLARISIALPKALALDAGPAVPALGPVEQPSLPLIGEPEQPIRGTNAWEQTPHQTSKRHKATSRSIERRLFPNPGDAVRRRQFRAFRMALILGIMFSAVVGLVLYLMQLGPRP
jgi:hypothetical protein